MATDANGCTAKGNTSLTEPAYIGWDKIGNVVDSSAFIGSTNNAALVFKTNNVERMKIDGGGNIGVGTATPTERMDVNGNINVGGSLKFGGDGEFRYFTSSGGTPATLTFGTHIAPPINPSWMTCYTPTVPILSVMSNQGVFQSIGAMSGSTVLKEMMMGHDGTNGVIESFGDNLLLNAYCNGLVGVGTATPASLIDVHGTAHVNSTLTVSSETYIAGKTGIGTTTPSAKLEVQNDITATGGTRTFCLTNLSTGGAPHNTVIMEPKLQGYDYNSITQPNDAGIFWTDEGGPAGSNNFTGGAGFVIAPWGEVIIHQE